MRRFIIIAISLLSVVQLSAQQENRHYLVGSSHQTNETYDVEFSDTGIIHRGLIAYPNDITSATASYSDPETGELLLFSDGRRIYNGDLEYIVNGEDLYANERTRKLFDMFEKAGYTTPFMVYILPFPNEEEKFYVFFQQKNLKERLFDSFYYTVEKNAEGRYQCSDAPVFYLGELVDYDNIFHIFTRHANGRDWWLILPAENDFKFYLIDEEGVNFHHEQELEVSYDLRRMTYAIPTFHLFSGNRMHFLYGVNEKPVHMNFVSMELDRCSGYFYNQESVKFWPEDMHVLPYDSSQVDGYGASALSPDGNYLFLSSELAVDQFDLRKEEWWKEKIPVISFRDSGLITRDPDNYGFANLFMWYGPDGRIYITSPNSTRHFGVINKPHRQGEDVGYEFRGISLPPPLIYSLTGPSYIDFNLGPVDGSTCDTLGLDNHVQALFRHDVLGQYTGEVDFRDLSKYHPLEWEWDFDDGNESTERYPIHTFAEAGIYHVCLTVRNENGADTYCEDVVIDKLTSTDEIGITSLSIYPNLVLSGEIYLHNPDLYRGKVELYSVESKRLRTYALTGVSTQLLEVDALPSGTYYLLVKTEKHGSQRLKFVVVE